METPASAAAVALAPLTECALKMEVSIPASAKVFFIHLAIVAEDASL